MALSRNPRTTRSIVSAACVAQSVPGTVGAYPRLVRPILALVVTALVAAFGALVLGEYQLTLLTAVAAGVGMGVLLGELMLAVGRRRGWLPAIAAAVVAGAAILWAAWIDSGEGLDPIRGTAWLGVGLAGLSAGGRLRPTRRSG